MNAALFIKNSNFDLCVEVKQKKNSKMALSDADVQKQVRLNHQK